MPALDRRGPCPTFAELDQEQLLQLFDEGRNSDMLTDWELTFVESLIRRVHDYGKDSLSFKQIAILDGDGKKDGGILQKIWEDT